MNAYEQRLVAIGLLCNLLTLLVLAPGWLPTAPVAEAAARRTAALTPAAPAAVYGADPSRTQAAVRASGWPQTGHNWCGVATVAAIARYRGHGVAQAGVATWMNSGAAISAWGTPSWNGAGPGFKANIARDSGTDPRALAAALDAQAQGGYRQLVDDAGRRDATAHLVADLVRTQEPISVIVLHGLHSVLVSGVLATADPVRHPESILGLQVWDPGVSSAYGQIQPTQETDVPLSQWLGLWVYWATPYNPNYFGALPADPDPAVGPYAYDPARGLTQHLWIGHYVYLQPGVTPGLNVDWAYDQNGNLIPGFDPHQPKGPATPTPPPVPTVTPTALPTATPEPGQQAQAPAATPAPGFPLGPIFVCTSTADCNVSGSIPWWELGLPAGLLALLFAGASIRLAARARALARQKDSGGEREDALVGSRSHHRAD